MMFRYLVGALVAVALLQTSVSAQEPAPGVPQTDPVRHMFYIKCANASEQYIVAEGNDQADAEKKAIDCAKYYGCDHVVSVEDVGAIDFEVTCDGIMRSFSPCRSQSNYVLRVQGFMGDGTKPFAIGREPTYCAALKEALDQLRFGGAHHGGLCCYKVCILERPSCECPQPRPRWLLFCR